MKAFEEWRPKLNRGYSEVEKIFLRNEFNKMLEDGKDECELETAELVYRENGFRPIIVRRTFRLSIREHGVLDYERI